VQHRLKANSNHPEIPLTKEYGNLPLIEYSPAQLNQVFMNLLSNAIDAVLSQFEKILAIMEQDQISILKF
jgi:signal transduction histidine kinase